MRIAVVATGEMGGGIAARLRARAAEVFTSLAGRSEASHARARAAGITVIDDDAALIASVEIFLSVVPPDRALALAERFAPGLAQAGGKILYADCNAVAPETVRAIAKIVEAAGAPFADAGIIGGPPKGDDAGPRLSPRARVLRASRSSRASGSTCGRWKAGLVPPLRSSSPMRRSPRGSRRSASRRGRGRRRAALPARSRPSSPRASPRFSPSRAGRAADVSEGVSLRGRDGGDRALSGRCGRGADVPRRRGSVRGSRFRVVRGGRRCASAPRAWRGVRCTACEGACHPRWFW